MRRDPVVAAIAMCERNKQDVTVANVAANVALTTNEYGSLIDSGLRHEVGRILRQLGYVTRDATTRARVEFKAASLSDLRALLAVKMKSSKHDMVQIAALRQLVDFLVEKEKELGYEPYVYLFAEDARHIYQMHGLELPSDWGRRV
jgi:hypothetical protein